MHPRRTLTSGVVALAAGALVLFAGPAALAQEPALTVDPDSGLSDGDSVTVTATGLDEIDGEQAAVTQCGNADTDGNPIPAAEAEGEDFRANCFGTEALGTPNLVLQLVSDAGLTVDYPVAASGIGANDATCIPNDEAELPCQIVVVDVTTEGDTLTVTAPIDFGAAEAAQEGEGTEEEPAEEEEAEEETEELAETGIGILPLAAGGAGLAGAGSLAMIAVRLRRRS